MSLVREKPATNAASVGIAWGYAALNGGKRESRCSMRLHIWITAIMTISQEVSAAAADGINAAADASNAFAADLYQHVGLASEQNTFFSPSSIATALAMTSLGARGETERQMWSVLKF